MQCFSSPGSAFFDFYKSGKGIALNCSVNFLLVANWTVIVYVVFWPDPGLLMQLDISMQKLTSTNIATSASLGISLEFSQVNGLMIGLLIEFLSLTLFMVIIMGYAAVRISRTLKRSTFSNSLRKMHGRMFTLLLVQTANPLIFLETPTFIAHFYLFTGLSTPIEVLYITGILLSLFPLMCPIIIIVFFPEYRKYTMNIVRRRKDEEPHSKLTFAMNVKIMPRSPKTTST
ncbi:hypothetical protein OESDEN_03895 [Oesophagostomum dentatum]|uniref:7TM chemoreceptor n=1 Tax=Oesophagostomum dentatum TaxID=61180 RepID=A0A0B1TF64_OESDE|nr:hypothetical protein OESDEN_03895 [Oesophagostomum dentatum]